MDFAGYRFIKYKAHNHFIISPLQNPVDFDKPKFKEFWKGRTN